MLVISLIFSMSNIESRIAIVSLRQRNNFIYNSCLYEFEDLIGEVDNVDLIELLPTQGLAEFSYKVTRKSAAYFEPITTVKPPLHQSIELPKEYDLLFMIVDFPYNTVAVNLINQWRKRSKVAACYLIELWKTELTKYKNYLKFLNNFDYVFLGHSQIVEDVAKITQRPCAYLAPACDTLKFVPRNRTKSHSDRTIDICSMGRRSQVTHQELLKHTQKQEFFYHYDPLGGSELYLNNHQAHRIFNANILKNTRYFIAHHAKINALQQTGGQIEIGYRFFEGAAAGAVMLGTAPNNNVFAEYFGWENAVVSMAFDEPKIADLITELDANPQLLQEISDRNVKYSLLKHDWVYRWEQVIKAAGIKGTNELEARKAKLQQLADSFSSADSLELA